MSRLQAQWRRLYAPDIPAAGAPLDDAAPGPGLTDERGQVRALVLSLSRPADWPAMARVWHGVQEELHLPAPAIAVNGVDGYQLWFSVAQAITVAQAQGFLTLLRTRYWADISAERVSLMPCTQSDALPPCHHADLVPAPSRTAGQWSAFVTRDLAPVFNDSPWLDIPPNPEGQADLLSSLRSIETADLMALATASPPVNSTVGAPQASAQNPREFLLSVMNDPQADLALRIEAAKALLQHQPFKPGP